MRRLEESKLAAESAARTQHAAYEAEVKRRQQQTAAELAALRTTVAQLQQTAPLARDRLNLAKDDLRDLTVTDDMYTAMRQVPEPQQSIREFVLVRVFELMRAHTKQAEPLRAECAQAKAKCADAEERAASLQRELARATKVAAEVERDLRRDVAALEARTQRLADECGTLQARVQEAAPAVSRYEAARARLDVLEAQHASLEAQQLMMSATAQRAGEERAEMQRRVADTEATLEHLRMDKAYLTKEVEALAARAAESTRQADRAHAECVELRRVKEELTARLLDVRGDAKDSYEQRLADELATLAGRSRAELDEIRTNQRAAFEREIAGLRDARESALRDAERAHDERAALRSQLDVLQVEHRQLECKYEAQMSELRALLKIKSFELDRAQVRGEEQARDMRALKLECEQVCGDEWWWTSRDDIRM